MQSLLTLNTYMFENNSAPIAHEIAHALAPNASSATLSEGLASIVQDSIGKNPSVFNDGQPIYPLSKQYLTEEMVEKHEVIRSTISIIGAEMGYLRTNMDATKLFYIFSYSFSKYLVDQYGIEKFMQVYEAESLLPKYEEVYGKTLEVLRNDWINYIRNYEAS